MKFKINSYSFRDGLNKVLSTVDKKNTNQILTNFLIKVNQNFVEVIGTDDEVSSKIKLNAEIETGGSFCINSKNLYDIIKELPNDIITFTKKENILNITCKNIKFSLVNLSTDKFPDIQFNHTENLFKLSSNDVLNFINKTSHCISTDETRTFLNGIFIQTIDSYLRAVAIDGHRLALINIKEFEGNFESLIDGIIIPKKGILELKKIADSYQDDFLTFSTDESYLYVNSDDNNFLTIRLISRDYPKYQTIIPNKTVERMVVDKDQILQAVKRIRLLSNEKTHGVKFSLTNNLLSVNANHPSLGNAKEDVQVEYSGDDISIGFNAKYIIDSLSVFETNEVTFEFNNELSPVVIKSESLSDYLGIIMPLKL